MNGTAFRRRSLLLVVAVLIAGVVQLSSTSPASARVKKGTTTTSGPTTTTTTTTTTPTTTTTTPTTTTPAPTDPALLTHRVGFGADVTGGGATQTTTVTDCGDDPFAPGPGTLRGLLATPGPHYVEWAESCTTHLRAPLQIPSDTTLDGSGQAVTLTGLNGNYSGLLVERVSNVIIHNLTVTDFGSPTLRQFNADPDGIFIAASQGVWIDHNTLANMGDKQLAVQTGSTNVTVSWNRFVGDAYNAQFFQIGNQYDGFSVSSVQNVTTHHNLYTGPGYRTPSISYGTLHSFNDVIENWVAYGIHCQHRAQCYMDNDVFVGSGLQNGGIAVKYRPSGSGCNDAGTLCDPTWGAGKVVNPYLPTAGSSADNSIETPACGEPAVSPCSWLYGSGPQTFTPSYPYSPERADAALQVRVEAEAGSHVTPRW